MEEHPMSGQATAWTPVPHSAVIIDDAFWSPRLKRNREQAIPYAYGKLRITRPTDQEPVPYFGWDSDIAKWLEAACYSLATHPDPALRKHVDEAVDVLVATQQPDGYLNPYFTAVKPDQCWQDLRDSHELYCAGHIMEAGVAHATTTGQRTLLDTACRLADMIDRTFGREAGQKRGYCGHPEIELALVKLARATGEQRYLRLAQYFVDERGQTPNVLAQEPGPHYLDHWYKLQRKEWAPEFCQSHRPMREQTEVVGHGVRAMYLYCGLADLAADTGDDALRLACRRLWDNLCGARLYITGGVGSSSQNEGFTTDFDLPNETAYCESCAAIGLIFWAHRLAHLEGDARYIDVLERALYNGVLSGISSDGEHFFYVNPLASRGNRHRQAWFGTACCPPNLARLLASLGGYIYGQGATDAVVHLYIGGTGHLTVGGQPVVLHQTTKYPWSGRTVIRLELARPTTFTLRLRQPGWRHQITVAVNGTAIDLADHTEQGYIRIQRQWRDGDSVQLEIPMPVDRVYAHPAVADDAGCVALQRGPVVYCLEECDHDVPLHGMVLPADAPLASRFDIDLLGGLCVVTADALSTADVTGSYPLYGQQSPEPRPSTLTAIPYFAWDNRAPGSMRVWVREAPAR